MARALVVCPATEELELIEYVDTPLGALLHTCSRFRPPTAMVCGRACARGKRCELGRSDAALDVGVDTEIEISAASADPITDPFGDPFGDSFDSIDTSDAPVLDACEVDDARSKGG